MCCGFSYVLSIVSEISLLLLQLQYYVGKVVRGLGGGTMRGTVVQIESNNNEGSGPGILHIQLQS